MNPGPTAKVAAAPAAAVPDYVLQLERAAHYLPPEQLPLLRRAWEVGAAAHAPEQIEVLTDVHLELELVPELEDLARHARAAAAASPSSSRTRARTSTRCAGSTTS